MARRSGNAPPTEARRESRPSPRREGPQGPSQRQLRVAEEVRHALAAVFAREEFRDPDLHGLHVTVTEVRASPDLKHMTAFVSGLGKDLTPAQFAGLRRVSPFLRTQVSRAVRLKFAPDLHFQPDTALDYAMHISKVMQRPEVQQDLQPKPATTPERQDDDAT
ncbi:30S ribosome-binding factor RbfA [Roseomonas stagni]|uniref:Ribosome-binding factor A n=1 Tax=Falsiroseomonas algicola TaxID=2716930 RepID=A0A6M1LME7_9PROT|nr:30S ribosome-binding factor RbfA [Falsiroseomonas algicola]NGM20994.1 30S ribosome-binding factor RbfA [Falsiroseomonas algicola]